MSTHLHESSTYVYHILPNLAFELPSRLAFQILPNKRDELVTEQKKIKMAAHVSAYQMSSQAQRKRLVIIPPRSSLSQVFCTNGKVSEQRIQSRNQLRKQLISRVRRHKARSFSTYTLMIIKPLMSAMQPWGQANVVNSDTNELIFIFFPFFPNQDRSEKHTLTLKKQIPLERI